MTGESPREVARQFVRFNGLPGAEDLAELPGAAAVEESMARFIAHGRHTGWNGLTQDDFDALQDAFDGPDAPPRKKQNPIVWKIQFWWHWHVTSPIVYPILFAPGRLYRYLHWHLWRKRHGGEALVAYRGDDGEGYLKTVLWSDWRDQCAAEGHPLPNEFLYLITVPLEYLRKHTGYGWDCPPCRIRAGGPGDAYETQGEAVAGIAAHVRDSHEGTAPDGSWIGEITWRGRA